MAGQVIGIVGGSGLYDLDGLTDQRWQRVDSPFGAPSDELLFGTLDEQPIVFLPRHGRGHRIPPHEINFLANIDALKRAGATSVISVSAVGSLREELTPGTFVLVDQFVDRTLRRPKTFFGTGLVAHVSMAHPTCGRLMDALAATAAHLGVKAVRGGTYVAMEGPQFSTKAEAAFHRQLGWDVVGMTNLPEAKLAREAEICYATIALATDYDCWREDEEAVSVEAVVQTLHRNVDLAKDIVRRTALALADAPPRHCECTHAVQYAVMTAPDRISAEAYQRLQLIIGRYFKPPA